MAEPVTAPEPIAAPGATSATPEAAASDAADLAAAIAVLTQPETAPAATPAPAASPEAAPAPAVEPPPAPVATEDTRALMARMARLEFEAESARDEAAKLRGGQEHAAKFAKIQELKAARNYQAVLTELGVTADELQSMILNGDKPLAPEVVELRRQTAELAEFKASLEAREQAAAQARAQVEFKTRELAPKLGEDVCPLGRAVYGDKLVDEVFAVLQHMYQSGNKNPSVAAAGKVVEDYLSDLRTKLTPSQVAAVKSAAAPTTTTLTNAPTTAPRVAIDMDTDEGRFEAAIKLLKGN